MTRGNAVRDYRRRLYSIALQHHTASITWAIRLVEVASAVRDSLVTDQRPGRTMRARFEHACEVLPLDESERACLDQDGPELARHEPVLQVYAETPGDLWAWLESLDPAAAERFLSLVIEKQGERAEREPPTWARIVDADERRIAALRAV